LSEDNSSDTDITTLMKRQLTKIQIAQMEDDISQNKTVEKVSALMMLFTKQRVNDPVDRNSVEIRQIWNSLVESMNSSPSKVKPEKIRCPKHNLQKYLSKRYGKVNADIICTVFKLPGSFNLDEYCEVIQDWIF